MKTYFLLLLFLPIYCYAQKQERQVFAYNIGLGAISSGLGAVINKPKHSDWKRYFIKGAWQGSVGGLLSYSGKKTIYLINKKNEPGYAWPAKFLHAAGTSIIENAALNEPFLQNWNIDIGLVRLDFSVNGSKPFKARLLPASVYAIAMGSKRGRMDWGMSVRTGTIAYYSEDFIPNNYLLPSAGLSFSRGFIYTDHYPIQVRSVVSHELMHTFQYRDFMILNTYLKPLEKKVKSRFLTTVFSKYIYFDIPYFHPIYLLEPKATPQNHFRNFFEFEAERFSTNKYVPR